MVLTVKNYQKSSLWLCFIIALMALRGANTFSVVLAYLSVGFRIIQAIAIVI